MADGPAFSPEEELDAHLAMMAWFDSRRNEGQELTTFGELERGFFWHGHQIPLISRNQGIWKPRFLAAALTFKTTARKIGQEAPYEDRIDEDGTLRYKMAATRDKEWTNRAMLLAAERGYPLAWLVGTKPANTLYYYARFPAFITGVDDENREFLVTIGGDPDQPIDLSDIRERAAEGIERKYVSRWTKQRLHQQKFREDVLSAYSISCAICDLPHAQLIEAAHIVDDANDAGVPMVANGMALCRIHHTAYDKHLLGIDESRRIHVAERARRLEEVSGKRALVTFVGRTLTHVPERRALQPDGQRLRWHFERFIDLNERNVPSTTHP
ncbi:HNH endonuclease [Actinomyces sp. W5033]|uniref:HNH endonuclease n=1 Tax=Actinomyces sp. W5033 TaxID=3446479 RepID=UPI003EDF430C